ncbi:hypothetical protein MTR67_024188 [Solanum verrucosum]|uniref:Alcohol dehydrogenase-like C-terminal domain-containing protein n=1 Tax=Solanum verrucosum TaxID=315347 RepID=A0AAF0TYX1_SOLVR|nr:hypothetical protein MTR67_024188 [Solanum verrucosum]
MLSAIQLVQDITGGYGVDVAVEALWRPQTFLQCVQSVRNGGKAVMIGLTLSGAKGGGGYKPPSATTGVCFCVQVFYCLSQFRSANTYDPFPLFDMS